MAKYLFATMPVPGHVAPIAPIARALVARGHEVVWYGSSFLQDRIAATGARFEPIQSTLDYGDSEYNRYFPERAAYRGLPQIKFDFKRLFVDAIPGYVKDLQATLKDFPADVLVGDPAVAAVRIVGEATGIPWMTVNISVLGLPGRDVAPFGLGMLPSYSALGRLRNATLDWLGEHVIFRDVNQHYYELANRHGWPRFPFRPAPSPYLYLQPSIPSFEYPRTDLPPQVHFIGPLLPDTPRDFVPPGWWNEVTSATRPVVLVTQGTIATDTEQLIAPTLEGLGGEDVLVVATTGGPADGRIGKVPANARIESFVPFAHLMPHVSAMVTNGGYGGTMITLAHGVPLVVAGISEDKPEVANRVAYAGVGLNLKTATPKPSQVRSAIRRILDEPKFRERAEVLREELAHYDAPRQAADLLEELASTKQPIYARSPAKPDLSPGNATHGVRY